MGEAGSRDRYGWNNGPPPVADNQGLAWREALPAEYTGVNTNPNWIGSMVSMRPPPPPLPQNGAWSRPPPPPPHYQAYAPVQQQGGMMPAMYGTDTGVHQPMYRVQADMRMHGNGRGGYYNQGRRTVPAAPSGRPMHPRPYLSSRPPAQKRKRKKDIVPPLEPMKEDAKVREPVNEAERREIEAWKAERRKHWPSEANVRRKEKEAGGDDRRISLMDVLDTQKKLGLVKKAGTEELMAKMRRGRVVRHDQRHQGQKKQNAGKLEQKVDPGSEGLLAIQGYSSGDDAVEIPRGGTFEENCKGSMHLEKRQVGRGKPANNTSREYRGQRNAKSSLLEKLLEKDIRYAC